MYAVIRTGGKQYRVAPGDIFEVEKLDGNVGDTITLDDVLMVVKDGDVRIGRPTVEGSTVTARITGQHRGEKILVFRYRPKKRIRVRRGHRQYLTRLQIEAIDGETGADVAVASAREEEPVAEEGVVTAHRPEARLEEPVGQAAQTEEPRVAIAVPTEQRAATVPVDDVEEEVARAGDVAEPEGAEVQGTDPEFAAPPPSGLDEDVVEDVDETGRAEEGEE